MTAQSPDYVSHKVKRAFETLDEAELLLSGGFVAGVINRLYYACFYAVSALLASEGRSSSKHSGVMSLFDQSWIKPGRAPKEMGAFYHLIFKQRQRGDYEDVLSATQEDLSFWLLQAKSFIEWIADLLRNNAGVETQ